MATAVALAAQMRMEVTRGQMSIEIRTVVGTAITGILTTPTTDTVSHPTPRHRSVERNKTTLTDNMQSDHMFIGCFFFYVIFYSLFADCLGRSRVVS